MACEKRVHATETLLKLSGEFGGFEVSHDQRGHGRRPCNVIALQGFQEAFNVATLEAAMVGGVVDVTGRWANHRQSLNTLWLLNGGQSTDHGTDRMPHEVDVVQVEFREDLKN